MIERILAYGSTLALRAIMFAIFFVVFIPMGFAIIDIIHYNWPTLMEFHYNNEDDFSPYIDSVFFIALGVALSFPLNFKS